VVRAEDILIWTTVIYSLEYCFVLYIHLKMLQSYITPM
jgi:hypothetical protein